MTVPKCDSRSGRFDLVERTLSPLWLYVILEPGLIAGCGRVSFRKLSREITLNHCAERYRSWAQSLAICIGLWFSANRSGTTGEQKHQKCVNLQIRRKKKLQNQLHQVSDAIGSSRIRVASKSFILKQVSWPQTMKSVVIAASQRGFRAWLIRRPGNCDSAPDV